MTRIEVTHSYLNEQLQYRHRKTSSRLIEQLIKNKFKDVSWIYMPRNIRDDIKNEYGVRLSYSKT